MNYDTIKALLEEKKKDSKINLDLSQFSVQYNEFHSPLIHCMKKRYKDLFLELLKNGANPNYQDEKVLPPITQINSNEEFIKELLNHPKIDLQIKIKDESYLNFIIKNYDYNLNKIELKNLSSIINKSLKKENLNTEEFFNVNLKSNGYFIQRKILNLLLKKTPIKILQEKFKNLTFVSELIINNTKDESILKAILDKSNPKFVDDFGNNLFHSVLVAMGLPKYGFISKDRLKIIVKMIEKGFDPNLNNKLNFNPHQVLMSCLDGIFLEEYNSSLIEKRHKDLDQKIQTNKSNIKVNRNKI